MNYPIFCKAVNFHPPAYKQLTPSQVLFKDFDKRFSEHYWYFVRKCLSVCKGENLHPEQSQRRWQGFK